MNMETVEVTQGIPWWEPSVQAVRNRRNRRRTSNQTKVQIEGETHNFGRREVHH